LRFLALSLRRCNFDDQPVAVEFTIWSDGRRDDALSVRTDRPASQKASSAMEAG
jgi:hypothetical protein